LEDPFYLVVDGTLEVAKELGAEVMVQDGRGKGRAVAQALGRVNAGTRYVVFIDADFTYPAEYVPKMIEVLEENSDVGMVLGNRFNERFDLRVMGNAYYFGNRFLAFMQYLLNGVRLRDPLTGLRVVRWEILRDWKPKAKGFDVEAELNYYVEKKGYRVMEIPIHYRKRLGEKKLKLRHGFTILRRILLESPHNF
jgi:dolichol-phosphate mannosyltransferase